jgi:hypothetical protein
MLELIAKAMHEDRCRELRQQHIITEALAASRRQSIPLLARLRITRYRRVTRSSRLARTAGHSLSMME